MKCCFTIKKNIQEKNSILRIYLSFNKYSLLFYDLREEII